MHHKSCSNYNNFYNIVDKIINDIAMPKVLHLFFIIICNLDSSHNGSKTVLKHIIMHADLKEESIFSALIMLDITFYKDVLKINKRDKIGKIAEIAEIAEIWACYN